MLAVSRDYQHADAFVRCRFGNYGAKLAEHLAVERVERLRLIDCQQADAIAGHPDLDIALFHDLEF